MEPEFWQQRWDAGQIAFHEGKPNAFLDRYVDRLGKGRVLVPLCGKAEDMALLAEKGFDVTGVDVVPEALAQFFAEHASLGTPTHGTALGGKSTRAGRVTLVQANMFEVEVDEPFDAVYDRAALVALKPDTRSRYVETLARCLRKDGKMLLVTFAYDQSKVEGPPFSVTEEHVRSLFSSQFAIEKLDERDAWRSPKFEAANITLTESVYVLTKG